MSYAAPGRFLWTTLATLTLAGAVGADPWPQWRGPNGNGVSDETGLPLKWDEKTNIVWKCPLAEGASTPAVWGDAIFVTTQDGDALSLVKINKKKGDVEWSRKVATAALPEKSPPQRKTGDERRHQKFHKFHNMASPTPATDGDVVIAHFGNGELAAYDFDGTQLWVRNLQKDLGEYTIWWGHANSPVLYKDLAISVCMQDSLSDLGGDTSPSYVIAHDKRSGKRKWKTDRMTPAKAEHCDSYTTPIFHKTKNGVEMIVMGGEQIDAYDPASGKQLWYLPGVEGNRVITGPTLSGDMLYTTRGMRGPLLAVKLGGEGKLTSDAIVWQAPEKTPDSPSPVVWKDLLFFISDDGNAHCVDAKTGAENWTKRLSGDFKASPIAADGRIYFLNMAGKCTVVAASATFEKLAENQVDDDAIASLAVSDGKLYLRGRKALYCIGEK
jgi:outer membrane protein assembly factor BamB